MDNYFQNEWITQYCGDALKILSELEDDSIDLLCTDPPYGIGFMGKDWDTFQQKKPTASQTVGWLNPGMAKDTKGMTEFFVPIWTECLRILKAGAFAFVMCSPRADVMAKQINALQDAGFLVNFTPIYWAYASGFPKATNIGKAVDKKLGIEREKTGETKQHAQKGVALAEERTPIGGGAFGESRNEELTRATSPQAKALEGSYGGFQPKPSVEVIIVAMKPLQKPNRQKMSVDFKQLKELKQYLIDKG